MVILILSLGIDPNTLPEGRLRGRAEHRLRETMRSVRSTMGQLADRLDSHEEERILPKLI